MLLIFDGRDGHFIIIFAHKHKSLQQASYRLFLSISHCFSIITTSQLKVLINWWKWYNIFSISFLVSYGENNDWLTIYLNEH